VSDSPGAPQRRSAEPPVLIDWPDDDLRHRIKLVVEVASGPGIEIVAAQLLLDVVQTLTTRGSSLPRLRSESHRHHLGSAGLDSQPSTSSSALDQQGPCRKILKHGCRQQDSGTSELRT